ncbi:tetratricopeptide repeat protein [candidate division KSB1 bacterium]|nr:tetratricopeptide repeat protein [candidate division KSB1 bacterium]
MKVRLITTNFLILFLLLTSCAYYNTFYNAKKYFKLAAKEREKRRTDKPTTAENQNYEKTIEKASRVLEFYPKSKYVDDALMLLGQCFFYKEEYHKAVRKFNELMEYDPNSEFVPEARLWLGKSYARLQDFENAKTVLRQIINSSADQKIKDEGLLLIGELYFESEDFASAAQEFDIAIEKIKDKKIKYRAGFLKGESYLKLFEYQKALEGFQVARKYSYDEETENAAMANMARCYQGLHDYPAAMKLLSDLLGKDSYDECWQDAKIEMAQCINKSDNLKEAMEWYYSVIEEHPRTEAAAKAYYHLGRIYEYNYGDYDSAYANYDKAKTQYRNTAVVDTANLRMEDIVELLSLKEVIKMQTTGRQSSIDLEFTNEETLDDTTRFRLKVRKAIRQLVRFRTTKPFIPLPDTLLADSLLADSLRLDTLWNKKPDEWGSGLVFSRRWGIQDTVNVADLQRFGFVSEERLRDERFEDEEEELRKKNDEDRYSPRPKMKARIPKLEKNNLKKNMLAIAELYFFKFALYDSALSYFGRLLDEPADTSMANVVPYIMYSMAYIYDEVYHDSLSADSIYQSLVDTYPKSAQAKKARQILGLPPIIEEKDPATLEFYRVEPLLTNEKKYSKAADSYLEIEQKYPESSVAARALYVAGYLYDQELNSNEKAKDIFNQLVEKYPDTEFAKKAKLKLDAAKKELERIEAEKLKQLKADSLAKIGADSLSQSGSDSLKTIAGDSLGTVEKDILEPSLIDSKKDSAAVDAPTPMAPVHKADSSTIMPPDSIDAGATQTIEKKKTNPEKKPPQEHPEPSRQNDGNKSS